MKRYIVQAVRSGDWWALSAPGVKGAHTQTRRLDQAEAPIRDMLALLLDVEPDSFEVLIEPILSEVQQIRVAAISRARREAEAARAEFHRCQHEAVRSLVINEGLTMRDAGSILGISYQRVAQLVREAEIEDEAISA